MRIQMFKLMTSLLLVIAFPLAVLAAEPRTFEFSYEIELDGVATNEAVDVYIPVATSQLGQQILADSMESSFPGTPGVESVHDNHYYRVHRPAGVDAPITASLRWTVKRATVRAGYDDLLPESERRRYLAPNALVPVGHEILDPILDEIRDHRASDTPADTARAIYDWVVDNIEYKKVGTGWGNGDTFWACNERYGNCTDFHALFVALARSLDIPARFEIGFPVPLTQPVGEIKGYHCWVQVYLPGNGWVPVDASEAAKHPEMRELYYGTQPADRVLFTIGRDLVVSEASEYKPLNYFIYPYVEIGGKPAQIKLETRFRYREVTGEG